MATWLLAGPFSQLLQSTLPFHSIEALSTGEILGEVISLPTLLALIVIAIGLAIWWQRQRFAAIVIRLQGLARMATNSFGFEAINRGVVRVVQSSAELLRRTQTGLLNWNVVGIVGGLIVVLIVLVWGA